MVKWRLKVLKKLFLTALVALALVGTVSAQGKVYKVAFVARAQADSFAAWLTNSIVEEAKKYKNIDLKVFDGQANDDTENALIENAITNKFDVIIIQPNNGESQRPYAVKVIQAGIFLITTNARIAGIRRSLFGRRGSLRAGRGERPPGAQAGPEERQRRRP